MRDRWRKIKESFEWQSLRLPGAVSLKFMLWLHALDGFLLRLDRDGRIPGVLMLSNWIARSHAVLCAFNTRCNERCRALLESQHQRWLEQQPKESAVMKYAMLLRGVRKD